MQRNMQDYEDMIDLPYRGPERHPHMSMHERAAQFAPFAALTGYDAAVRRKAQEKEKTQI